MEAPGPAKKTNKNTMLIVGCLVALPLLVISCGCLASTAIPAFLGFVARSKSSEAQMMLQAMAQGATLYYNDEHPTAAGSAEIRCTVDSAAMGVPGSEATLDATNPSFDALHIGSADPHYYRYEIDSGGASRCGAEPGPLYTLRAIGDLDGDGTTSLFELTLSVDASGEVTRGQIAERNPLE